MASRQSKQGLSGRIANRSGIPPLVMLQVLEEGGWSQDAKIMSKLLRCEMSRHEAFFRLHPCLVILTVLLGSASVLFLISS